MSTVERQVGFSRRLAPMPCRSLPLLLLLALGCASVSSPSTPVGQIESQVPPGALEADFSGTPGLEGGDGFGHPAITDVASVGSERSGQDGDEGEDGGRGGAGEDVDVFVSLRSAPIPLLRVKLVGAERMERFELDPRRDLLFVRVNGGPGGGGGDGGDGAPGDPAGRGGRGGNGGEGGRGGTIVVHIDPAARPYAARLHFENRGGPGGAAGQGGEPGSEGPTWFGGFAAQRARAGLDGHAGRRGEDGPPVEWHWEDAAVH